MLSQLIILIMLSLGLLLISFIILIKEFIQVLREKSNEYYVIFIIIGIVLILLIPVILGMIQEII